MAFLIFLRCSNGRAILNLRLKVKPMQKPSLVPAILLMFVCFQVPLFANAQEDDLFNAAGKGNLPRVQALLANGVDVNTKSQNGGTALVWAAYFGKLEVVKALVGKGAEIDAKDNDGETALFMASRSDHPDVVLALLDRKAAIDARTQKGETALMWASQEGHIEIV